MNAIHTCEGSVFKPEHHRNKGLLLYSHACTAIFIGAKHDCSGLVDMSVGSERVEVVLSAESISLPSAPGSI